MMKLPSVLVALVVLTAVPTARAAEPNKLDPGLPYQALKSNPVTYDVDFSAVVTPPYNGRVLKVWLPRPIALRCPNPTHRTICIGPTLG
jgi:hypothetical protein